jgi:predicted  nucleic acid-binding Zn-ribbon protein
MSADKLSKELQQFERMTRAVLTVGDAVKDGLLKQQTLDQLDAGIVAKKDEVAVLEKEKADLKSKISSDSVKAKGIIEKANTEAEDILARTKIENASLKTAAKEDVSAAKQKVSALRKETEELDKLRLSLEKDIAKQEKTFNEAKDKFLSVLS